MDAFPRAQWLRCRSGFAYPRDVDRGVSQALAELSGATVPLGAYANGFNPIPEDYKVIGSTVEMLGRREDLTPAAYADFAEDWARLGATIIGGCCEVGPAHIAELSRRLKPGKNPG